MHYIRFLSPPQVSEAQRKTLIVSAVLAVTTDLGDAYFPEQIDLMIRVIGKQRDAKVLCEQEVTWKPASRALKVALQCPGKYASEHVRVHVATCVKESTSIPNVLDVWSMAFELANKQRAEPLVDRKLQVSNNTSLTIREETGDSIARHVWDASLGFLMYLQQIASKSSHVRHVIETSTRKPIKVLELGAGCGVVGIALAQLYPCDMLLTDLDEAIEILQTNIKLASIKSGSTLRAEVLDWSMELQDSINVKYDLVIVSDCIYNPDSSVHLVETLQRLARLSPQAIILVGFKRRHYADDVFFDRMKTAKFEILETENIALPHTTSEYDTTQPTIEFYTYQPPA